MATPNSYSKVVKGNKKFFSPGLDAASGGLTSIAIKTGAGSTYGAGTDASGHLQESQFHAHAIGTITLANGAGGALHADFTSTTGIGAVTLSTKMNSYGSGLETHLVANSGNIASIRLAATGPYAHAYVTADANGSIGNVTIADRGAHTHAHVDLDTYTSGNVGGVGNIGKVTLTNTGYSAYASAYVSADGNIGAITINDTGDNSQVTGHADAYSGNIGNITITAIGANASAHFSAYAEGTYDSVTQTAVGGSVGNISLAAKGDNASAYIDVHAQGVSVGGHYVGGGDIGNLAVAETGNGAYAYIDATAYSGGSIGTSTITVDGVSAGRTHASIYASVDGTSDHAAAIGNVVMTVNGGVYAAGAVFQGDAVSGNIGDITGTVNGGSSGILVVMAYASDLVASGGQGVGGTIGDITLTNNSYNGGMLLQVAADTQIGTITATLGGGNGFHGYIGGKGDVGAITLNFATDDASQYAGLILNTTTASDVGPITVTGGGNTSSFEMYGYGGYDGNPVDGLHYSGLSFGGATAHSIAGIDLSKFNGRENIDLSRVASGVEVLGSIGGGTIIGTSFDDTITGGIGQDSIDGGAGNDTITGGAGGDLLNVGTGTDTLVYAGNSDTLTSTIGDGFTFKGTGADIVTGMGDGDVINLHGIANLTVAGGAVQVGTIFLDGTHGNLVNVVSGSYDATTGVFTAGAASDNNNDYVVQYTGGATATDVHSLVLVDIVGTLTASANATTGAITLSVTPPPVV